MARVHLQAAGGGRMAKAAKAVLRMAQLDTEEHQLRLEMAQAESLLAHVQAQVVDAMDRAARAEEEEKKRAEAMARGQPSPTRSSGPRLHRSSSKVPMDMAWTPSAQPRQLLIPQLDDADQHLAELASELADLEREEEAWALDMERKFAAVKQEEDAFADATAKQEIAHTAAMRELVEAAMQLHQREAAARAKLAASEAAVAAAGNPHPVVHTGLTVVESVERAAKIVSGPPQAGGGRGGGRGGGTATLAADTARWAAEQIVQLYADLTKRRGELQRVQADVAARRTQLQLRQRS